MKSKVSFFGIGLLLLTLGFVFIANISISYAKYVTEESNNELGVVANYEFVLGELVMGQESYQLELQEMNPTSPDKVYALTITNGAVGNISETALQYNLSISKTGNLPLEITLKDNSNASIIKLDLITSSGTTAGTYAMGTGMLNTHIYTLTISWIDFNLEADYAGLIDLIEITASYEQIN